MKLSYESIRSSLILMTAVMEMIIEDSSPNNVAAISASARKNVFFKGKEINESLLLKELEEAKLRAEEMKQAFLSGITYIDHMKAYDPDLLDKVIGSMSGSKPRNDEVIH